MIILQILAARWLQASFARRQSNCKVELLYWSQLGLKAKPLQRPNKIPWE
jgi:hypothetical protein